MRTRPAHRHTQAVIGQNIEGFDIFVGLAGHHRMHTAGVVADHAADGATVMARGIGPEGQMMFLGGVAEIVEHHAGLDPRNAPLRIDLQDDSCTW